MPLHDQLLERAKAAGLRRTKALEAILECLASHNRPMTLAELTGCGHLSEQCDQTTVFRLLQRLSDKGMVRRLGLHERAAYFTLLIPGVHRDYLICTDCGSIESIQAPCPVHKLQEEIQRDTGFQNLYHELEFFGTCPKCSSKT
ncbi:transcriptional repressor [Akkermansiaceae bacterium]|nr:transcriptional repressor [Akkermansiaceae bacterium]